MMGVAHWHDVLSEACIDPSAEKVYNYIFECYCYAVSFSSYRFFCSVKRGNLQHLPQVNKPS